MTADEKTEQAPRRESAAGAEIRGIGERLDALDQAHQERDARETVERAMKVLGQQRARASLELDFAGWNAHADVAVWSLGYHDEGAFRVVPNLSRSTLSQHWFPLLHKQGITP